MPNRQSSTTISKQTSSSTYDWIGTQQIVWSLNQPTQLITSRPVTLVRKEWKQQLSWALPPAAASQQAGKAENKECHITSIIYQCTPPPQLFCHSWLGCIHESWVPRGSPWPGGDVTAYVYDITNRACPLLSILFLIHFCLYGPFNCISSHKFSWQPSIFSLCSSGLICALLVLSIVCLLTKVSFSPDIIPCSRLGPKHQLTN